MLILSVIVPVYNTEEYLEDCIKSILMQSLKEFELIIVNDGSTDGSLAIIKKFAVMDPRIVMINTEHKGVSNARNVGLKAAKGRYIGFVDADDYITPEMYQMLMDSIQQAGTDIACCRVNQIKHGVILKKSGVLPSIMDNKEFIIHVFDQPQTAYSSVWNKIFIRDKITEEFDTNLIINEDTKFLVHYAMEASSVSFVDYVGYYYNRNERSITMRDAANIVEGIPARRVLIEELELYSEKVFKAAEKNFLDTCCYGVATALNNRKLNYYHIVKNEFLLYVRKHLRHILSNRSISWKLKIVIGVRTIQCLLLR